MPVQPNDPYLTNMDADTPIKLLILPSWYPPRGGEFFREHGLALAGEGLKVDVVALNAVGFRSICTLHGDTRCTRNEPAGFSERVKSQLVLPGHARTKARRWVRHLVSMTRDHIHANGKPDIMQVQSGLWAGLAAREIHRTTGIPYIITEHRGRFIAGNPYAESLLFPWQESLLKEAFEEAGQVVTVSRALQEKIASLAPACKDRIITIPNMVDTGFFAPPGKTPPGPFTFFCLAHLETGKGIDTLLEATRMLTDRKAQPVRVVIGGDGPQRRKLERMVRELSLENTITFTGALGREEVRDNLHKSHAFVLPSRFEAFGVVYIEAMACGLPVIATKAGGPTDFVSKETGLLVEAGQAAALATAMHDMMQQPGDYRPDRIREAVTRRFSKKVIAGAYVALYQQVIEKNRKHD